MRAYHVILDVLYAEEIQKNYRARPSCIDACLFSIARNTPRIIREHSKVCSSLGRGTTVSWYTVRSILLLCIL